MMADFNHILVPVDFSEKNLAAINVAQQLAQQSSARVTLLHVIEFIDYPDDQEMSSFYEKLEQRSQRELNKLLELFAENKLDVTVETVVNHRCKGIVLYAVDNDVDLIVMSSHPVGVAKHGAGWSTISYQVSALCPCSILLVKSP